MARCWVLRRYRTAPDVEDLAQEACIGVMKALDSYDPEKASFSTYGFRGGQLAVLRAMELSTAHRTTSSRHAVRQSRRNDEPLRYNRSLTAQVDEGLSLEEVIPDNRAESPRCELWDDQALTFYRSALRVLAKQLSTERLRAAARALADDESLGVKEVGDRVGLSHERVNHVRNRAIQMARDKAGINAWLPKRRMVPAPRGRRRAS